jgi:hypothetical protein
MATLLADSDGEVPMPHFTYCPALVSCASDCEVLIPIPRLFRLSSSTSPPFVCPQGRLRSESWPTRHSHHCLQRGKGNYALYRQGGLLGQVPRMSGAVDLVSQDEVSIVYTASPP